MNEHNDNLPELLRDPETAYVFAGQAADAIERLTRERDYWERARNEWEKSANMLEEENKRLRAERDEAVKTFEIAKKAYHEWAARSNRNWLACDAAERKLAMAVEALIAIERDRDNRWKSQKARATLAALEKNDE